jgi:probable O-glycosylation ligase (exosortase A-associated)
MLVFFWLKSRTKVATAFMLVMLVPVAWQFMPEAWHARMDTIQTYEEDPSAMGRINAWKMAFNLAQDRPFVGGGFDIYNPTVFGRYAPVPDDIHAAHSIYFQMLGEHGFVGLALFLFLWFLVWRDRPGLSECKRPGRFAVGIRPCAHDSGQPDRLCRWRRFLSLAYYDVPYDRWLLSC